MEIRTDWRPVYWGLLWTWLLIFIPTIFQAVSARNARYRFAEGALIAQRGWITKRTTAVDLYRVKTVSAVSSPFTGGQVTITSQDGSTQTFKLIRNAEEVVSYIRSQAESERAAKNFKYRESF